MGVFGAFLLTCFFLGLHLVVASQDGVHYSLAHRIHQHLHRNNRKQRAADGGVLRFEPEPFSKKMEVNSTGKIHCKVAGGMSPNVTWFLNDQDPLPEGVTSSNGTLLVARASHQLAGQYTCKAVDGDHSITAKINLDVVMQPRILEPAAGAEVHVTEGQTVWLNCIATGEPKPTTHWDRNLTILNKDTVEVEDGANATHARMVLLNNGTLFIRSVVADDARRYGCTAGSHAGLARHQLTLIVHPPGELPQEASGVAGKAVIVSISVAVAYMILVLALMLYCRRRRLKRRQRGEKLELEMQEGREKLVEGEEEKKVGNGSHAPLQNGRLLPCERDSGADNSEVSAISRVSKKSGQYDHLSVPKSLLTDLITLGRGEFGDVLLAKIDINQVRRLRNKTADTEPKMRPVLVKTLTTKDEAQLTEFRRQLDMFSRVRHENIVRLIGLCNQDEPHYMLLEHTDWGDLKNFLIATRTPQETQQYLARVHSANTRAQTDRQTDGRCVPLSAQHKLLLTTHLACACATLHNARYTHRDIAARNCVITSKLHLKLSLAALARGPDSHEYYKLHDQVIPLRWLPPEAVLEGEYSAKSDVYMFAATVWEMYTKAELPFCKLSDASVLERLAAGALPWPAPAGVPDRLACLLRRCWSISPSERPQFSEITEEVSSILQEITAENTKKAAENNE